MNLNTQQKNLFHFILKLGFIYLIWKLFYYTVWYNEAMMIAYKAFTMNVINMILVHTSYLLEFFSYDTEIIAGNRLVRIVDTVGVSVGEPCIAVMG